MLPYDEYLKELQKFPTSFRIGVDFYRTEDGDFEVLIDKRDDDEFYHGHNALFGSTILMREDMESFWKRFSTGESEIPRSPSDPEWIFCGIMETPNTKRHHGMIQIFGRVWDERPQNGKGEWMRVSAIEAETFVPSEYEALQLARKVLIQGESAHYIEFTGVE